jgi:DNA-binding LacI/PurR family transcriptional regulator
VRQPLAEMGSVAAEMLGTLIDGLPLASRRVELATQLVVRASTARPPGARTAARRSAGATPA